MEWLMELLGRGGGSVMDGYVPPKEAALAEARRTGDKRTIDLIEKGLIDPKEPELPSATSRAIANLQSGDRTRGLGINPSVIDQVGAGIGVPEMELPSEFDMASESLRNSIPSEEALANSLRGGGPDQNQSPYELGQDLRALPGDALDFASGGAASFNEWLERKKQESITRQDRQDANSVYSPLLEGIKGNADPSMNNFEGQIGGMRNSPDDPYWLPPGVEAPVDPDMSGLEGQPFVGDFDAPGAGLTTDEEPSESYKKPPAPAQGEGTGTSGNPSTTGAGVEKAPVDTTPVKENPMNAVQRFAQDKLGWDEDKRADMSRALITGGLATMAGDSPYAMQNIGMGGLAGVDAYYGAKDQRRDESLEDDAIAMQKELHEIRLAEGRRAAEKHGIDMKKMKKLEETGIDPLDLLTGSAKSKAYAALLYKNGELDEETYKSILGIKDEEEAF